MPGTRQRRFRASFLPLYADYPPPLCKAYRSRPQHSSEHSLTFNPEATEFTPSETFWHHYTPGLQYSPHFGICYEMNPEAMFTYRGTKIRSGHKARVNHNRRNPHQQEMVDVYNDECFIKAVPLRALVRFSAVAARKFSRPRPTLAHRMAPPRDSEVASSSKKGWASVTAAATSDADSEPSSSDPMSTEPTERSTPLFEPSHSTAGGKQLILILGGVDNPSNEAVMWTLKWMVDNADSNDKLIPYAPDLRKLDFEDLVDFYQASLMVELRPVPRHILAALMQRVTDQPPTPAMFQSLSSYIPVGSVVIDRAITSFFQHRSEGEYSREQLDEFEDHMSAKRNDSVRQRRDYIFSVINFKKGSSCYVEQEKRRERANSAAQKERKLARKDWRQGSNDTRSEKDLQQTEASKQNSWRQQHDFPSPGK